MPRCHSSSSSTARPLEISFLDEHVAPKYSDRQVGWHTLHISTSIRADGGGQARTYILNRVAPNEPPRRNYTRERRREGKPACLLCLALSNGPSLRLSPGCVRSRPRSSLGRNQQSNKRRHQRHTDRVGSARTNSSNLSKRQRREEA